MCTAVIAEASLQNGTIEASSTVTKQSICYVDILQTSYVKFGPIINTILMPLCHEK